MNRVLAAERMSQAQLVEARTKAEVQRIEAQVKAESQQLEAESLVQAARLKAQAEAEAQRIKTEAETQGLSDREEAARIYSRHPALLRLQELEALRELARTANARIYIGFEKHLPPDGREDRN
jgi:regulator of protease activity HflC (stomatin/prohibitin superfamily)